MSGEDEFWRRVKDEARATIIHIFGQAWRGGKFDASYLSNRVPFLSSLQQHGNTIAAPVTVGTSADSAGGTVTFPTAYPSMLLAANSAAGAGTLRVAQASSLYLGPALQVRQVGGSHLGETVSVTAIDTTTTPHTLTLAGVLTNGYSTNDVLAIIPDVELTSRDPAFTVALDPTHAWPTIISPIRPNNDVIESGFAYVVSRLQSLTGVSSYIENVVIGAGVSSVNPHVSFMTDLGYVFTGVPAVIVTSMDTDYEATVQPATVSGSGFSLMVTYKPATPPTTAKASSGVAVNDYTGNTGDTTANHHHVIPQADYTLGNGNTSGQSNEHQHTDSHPHGTTEPNSGAGHEHGPVGAPASPGATVPCIYWVYGTRIAAAASTVSIRWQAQG